VQTTIRCVTVLAGWFCLSCASGMPARTPECNAKVNRCMEQCADRPSAMEPRNQVVSDRTNAAPVNSCEQQCNRC
jgi:hypothetical protein